jgi:glycosyltransferase involved in cell wall biosynthesis
MKALISVIISTQNRAMALEQTLRAFGNVSIPEEWSAELIVVDNASKDNTAQVVQTAQLSNFKVRYLYEGKPGKSNALNTGFAAAQGEVFLFTDDDVVPAKDWLEKIATPLLQRECDGVTGRLLLADSLLRPWMKADHKMALSASGEPAKELVGANMGLHRSVFEHISGFDTELGPGVSGFGEETLFTWQMEKAGLRWEWVPEAIVVHHPDAARLLHSDWLNGACKRGRSMAYLLHHWQHGKLKSPLIRYYYLAVKLFVRRILQPPPALNEEGCPPWEMSYLAEIEMCKQFIKERKRPRNYSLRGLQKNLDGLLHAKAGRPCAAANELVMRKSGQINYDT